MIKTFKLLILIFLPAIIVLSVMHIVTFDYSWYNQRFIESGTYQTFGAEPVKTQVSNLFGYLKGNEKLLEGSYTQREILHLQDVHTILSGLKIFSIFLIFIFIASLVLLYVKDGIKETIKILLLAGIFSLAIHLFIIFLFLTNFDSFFYNFHKIVFQNNYWLLDPNIELLVVVLPPDLFNQLGQRIIKLSLLIDVIISLLFGFWLLMIKKRLKLSNKGSRI